MTYNTLKDALNALSLLTSSGDALEADLVNLVKQSSVHAEGSVTVLYSGNVGAFQFTKYGMVEGQVLQVGADASDKDTTSGGAGGAGPLLYRTLVALESDHLAIDGRRYPLNAGMQVAAEVKLGSRSVMEYLLSPIQRAFHDAGRER